MQMLGSPWQADQADFPIYFPQTMAATPEVMYYGSYGRDAVKVYNGAYYDITSITSNHRLGRNGVYARVKKGSSDTSTWPVSGIIQLHAHWEAVVPD